MKIVILSQYISKEKIIVHEIVKNFDNVTLIHSAPNQKSGNNSITSVQPKKINRSSYLDHYGLKLLNKFHKISFKKKTKHLNIGIRQFTKVSFPFNEINTERGLEFLRSIEPDILFTCNAPLLRGQILDVPKIAALNVHFGIPPHYRGNDTLFWAYYKKDFENLGGCIHYTTKGVDKGNVLAEVFPSMSPNDSLVHLDIKTSELLAKAAVTILKEIENNDVIPTGKEQSEKGRNYKLREKKLMHQLKYLAQMNLGLLKPRPRKEKMVFYTK